MEKLNLEAQLALEQPMIKVSIEQLKRAFRTSQKHLEKEMIYIISQSNLQLATQNEVEKSLDSQIIRLERLKRKLQETRAEENVHLVKSERRIAHLNELKLVQPDQEAYDRFTKYRLNRILVDDLLRKGYIETATKLTIDSKIEDLVDTEVFVEAQKVTSSLQQRSSADALMWCTENKALLKRTRSSFEFNLRFQEYIELVRDRKLGVAIAHVKKYLSPWSETHMIRIQQAMGLLAFGPDTECDTYQLLYSQTRWTELVEEFKAQYFAMNSLTKKSTLAIALEAGLSALKTASCKNPLDKNENCPICDSDNFALLADPLPPANYENSVLLCRITGKVMDADNPPLVLPNGYVYSTQVHDSNTGN